MLETLSSLLFLFPNPPSLGFALDGGGGGGALLPPDPKLGLFCEGGGGGGAAATWFDEGPFVWTGGHFLPIEGLGLPAEPEGGVGEGVFSCVGGLLGGPPAPPEYEKCNTVTLPSLIS